MFCTGNWRDLSNWREKGIPVDIWKFYFHFVNIFTTYNNIITNLLPQKSIWKIKMFMARCLRNSDTGFLMEKMKQQNKNRLIQQLSVPSILI